MKGRSRFRVPPLRNAPALKRHLEAHLPGREGILSCSASATTGTLLCFHSRKAGAAEIQTAIEQVLGLPLDTKPPLRPALACVPESTQWHRLDAEEVLGRLGSSQSQGLLKKIAQKRMKKYGRNVLTAARRRTGMEIFSAQFKTLPVALLTASAGLSIVTGGAAEAAVILAVVVANAYIGYGTEKLAELTITLLSKMGPSHVVVIRDGKPRSVLTEDVVPGDIMVLVPGMYVPADGRLLQATGFTVDESALTGESMPVTKSAARLKAARVPLAERRNMVYRGTVITGGNALAVIVATGERTEIGKIQSLVAQTKPSETPIQKQMHRLSTQLVGISGYISGGVFLAGMLRGYGLLEMVKTSVTLAIAAVPEGLPTVATTTLAQSALRMKKRNVLVRNLHAVETLGATQAICLDKTGTLTMNKMSVVTVIAGMEDYQANGKGLMHKGAHVGAKAPRELERLFEVAILCNDVETGEDKDGKPLLKGSPTETALVEMGVQQGMDLAATRAEHPLLAVEHRTEERSYMVTTHALPDGGRYFAVKGSPEQMLALCNQYMADGKVRPLTEKLRATILTQNENLGAAALRVLGFAYAETREGETPIEDRRLTWLGHVGLADRPRDGIKELIAMFHEAGIRTSMITGDQSATAEAIAAKLSISGREPLHVFDWGERETVEEALLNKLVQEAHVFARVSPADKLQIVESLKADGKVVAMVGDGINDAPALKTADIGVAMGKRGTEVAREVADAVLTDDNLHSLINAIELGRTTFDSIRKSVVYLLGTNLSESLIVFGSMVAGLGQPLNPLQLLWINLVSDVFPALALGLEPAESDVLKRPPRPPDEPIVSKDDFKRIAVDSSVMTAATLGTYVWGIARHGQGQRAQSMAFMALTSAQLLHTLSCRSENWTIFDGPYPKANKYIGLSLGLGFGLQALPLFVPRVARMLGTARLGPADLAICAVGSLASFLGNESIRHARRLGRPTKQVFETRDTEYTRRGGELVPLLSPGELSLA